MSVRFEAFYTAAFQTSLNDLDRIRRRIITNYFVIGFVMFAGFTFEAITWMLIGILVIVLFVMFYIRTFGISTQYYQQQFFLRIQGSIGRFLLPSSSFDLNRYIKLTELQAAGLIVHHPQQYGGRNMIEHAVGDDQIRIAEMDIRSSGRGEDGKPFQRTDFSGIVGVHAMHTGIANPLMLVHHDLLKTEPDPSIRRKIDDHQDLVAWYVDKEAFARWFSPSQLYQVVSFMEAANKQVFISVFQGGVCVAVAIPEKEKFRDAGLWTKANQEKEIRSLFETYRFVSEMLLSLNG